MYLIAFARSVLFFPVAFVLSFGSAKAITVNATQSLLIDGTFTSFNVPGIPIVVAIQTSAADPFDGAPGGYNVKFFNTSNVGSLFVTKFPAAGSTFDAFSFINAQPLNSILLEATSGASFDVINVSLSSPSPLALLVAAASVQAVAAPYNPTVTPLPAALPLFATGLGALGLLGWRRKRKASAT